MNFKNLLKGLLITTGLALSSLNVQADSKHIIEFDDVAWKKTGLEGAEMAILWGKEEDGSAVFAFRIQPGVSIPPHFHKNDYWGIAVQGNWVHIDAKGKEETTSQGAYTMIKGGDLHSDRCGGPEVCINVLDFNGARDIVFPKK